VGELEPAHVVRREERNGLLAACIRVMIITHPAALFFLGLLDGCNAANVCRQPRTFHFVGAVATVRHENWKGRHAFTGAGLAGDLGTQGGVDRAGPLDLSVAQERAAT
jgi:hypothetical protein